MQISPSTSTLGSAPGSPLPSKPTGPEAGGKGPLGELAARRTGPSSAPDPVSTESAPTDSVSISPEVRTRGADNSPTPVYAEIWKGTIKIAQVDIHGHVQSYSGLLASSGGSGLSGQLLAAQRTVQVAQQVGGEIRTAGQAIDGQTLLMRARLANSYLA